MRCPDGRRRLVLLSQHCQVHGHPWSLPWSALPVSGARGAVTDGASLQGHWWTISWGAMWQSLMVSASAGALVDDLMGGLVAVTDGV